MTIGEFFLEGCKYGFGVLGAVLVIGIVGIALVALAALFGWAMSDPEDDDGKD